MIENSKIKTLLEKYMLREINQNELINETKKIFYENLKDNRYNIEFIEEYYFMTEILDLSDCNEQECDNYVSNYIAVYNGQESLKSTISVLLHKEYLPKEVLDTISIIEKFILECEVTAQEKNRIKHFMEDGSRNNDTLYDLVIDQLKNLFQWGFDYEDVLLYEPKSILDIYDKVDLKTNVFEKMKSIIASLLGNKPIWITCIYEKGKCNLQVVI